MVVLSNSFSSFLECIKTQKKIITIQLLLKLQKMVIIKLSDSFSFLELTANNIFFFSLSLNLDKKDINLYQTKYQNVYWNGQINCAMHGTYYHVFEAIYSIKKSNASFSIPKIRDFIT